jgi:hypothetical protein
MAAVLPVRAAAYLSRYIDPADAFLAHHDGLTVEQAHSHARNAARPLGTSWPDRIQTGDLVDPDDLLESLQACGLYGADPREIIEVCERVQARLDAANAPQTLLAADWRDADPAALADLFRVTQRRAQQIVKKALEQGGAQGDLFGGAL